MVVLVGVEQDVRDEGVHLEVKVLIIAFKAVNLVCLNHSISITLVHVIYNILGVEYQGYHT